MLATDSASSPHVHRNFCPRYFSLAEIGGDRNGDGDCDGDGDSGDGDGDGDDGGDGMWMMFIFQNVFQLWRLSPSPCPGVLIMDS